MRFTVIYVPSAENELASIWTRAPDKQAVADASDEIDDLLKFRPLDVGEALEEGRRLHVPPLEVVYTVSPDDCMVRVVRISYRP